MRELRQNGTQPIRVILPGMCYRYEQITARSEMQFHQVEGLAIGRNITHDRSEGHDHEFARRMFGAGRRDSLSRVATSRSPSRASKSMSMCLRCERERCMVDKGTGWLEITGAGMVHPTCCATAATTPTSGAASPSAWAPQRMAMLKHGIDDIRYFWGNDLRFLEQF